MYSVGATITIKVLHFFPVCSQFGVVTVVLSFGATTALIFFKKKYLNHFLWSRGL